MNFVDADLKIGSVFYWFNPDQTTAANTHLISADGKAFTKAEIKSDTPKTLIVDLEASGIDMDKWCSGFHQQFSYTTAGETLEISDARLMKSVPKA